ncbi:bifunctional tetrahydrofolate synthase/dihydrofolate synthase [Kutzneria kofuensis]|uniref:Dihydrofolate synthase/folylpolyglutamate synthase n=1 Tax=Kutzneria kofuensis TaxID=103725 RepID=A0A7W9KDW3_9PSEU|nr:folylpolyglutamate synthase/dihydrofolate synthase family protein [Kutzneria kofuensis]MBB5890804.1 dihydrofolate synthase/folylpolyglutamate synthase [Kutzneria kofuensis]
MPQNDPEALAALREVESELDTRWPETKIEPSTERIAALADLLGEPQRAYPVVHITGTNGKTSTSRMIDALFTRIGLRTGRYTSPHLQLATERISLDGAPVSPQRYVDVYRDIEPYIAMVDAKSDVKMSKFEVLTGMAFAAFADAPVDVAVVEVGLGGRWDATNIADGKVAVITPIDIDHTDFLGTDILGIAAEKAGIIKEGAVAVLAEQRPEVAQVLLERCAEVGASVARQGMEFGVLTAETAVGGQLLKLQGLGGVYDEIFLPLFGAHQAANAAQALAAVEVFFGAGAGRKLDIDAVREAFATVTSPGRLERVRNAPSVFVDAAHNPHGARALAAALQEQFAFRKLVGVVSVMEDKDVDGILAALEPVFTEVVLTNNGSPRAMDADKLAGLAREVFGEDRIVVEPRLDDAVEEAIRLAEEIDDDSPVSGSGVVVTGSVVTAGAARALFGKEPQ